MTKDLMAKANANIKSKGINLAKNKVIAQVSELLQKSKVGAFLRKKWYTWVPTVLVHDMFFIHLVNKINEHFGIINQSVITKMAEGYSKLKTDEEKEMFMTKTNKVLEKTNNLQEFESKISKGELNVTKIDTSNVDRDSKTNAIKLKPGYDSPNYYDSLNNVYKQ
jgi:Asp-tRNA(Asn)/Glu-tRNA(Gln) amidotransferase C subunit